MKRLLVLLALIASATATPCAAATLGLFRSSQPLAAPVLDNPYLWVAFAPQPEPPYAPRFVSDEGTMVAESMGPFAGALVGVAIEGAGPLGAALNSTATIPLSSFGGTSFRLTSRVEGVPGAIPLTPHFSLLSPVTAPPQPPAGTPFGAGDWLWLEVAYLCPPGADCRQYADGEGAKVVVLRVDDGSDALVPMQPVQPVAEPTSLLLLAAGLAGLRTWRKRRG